jgi:dihydrofolate reductase
MKINIICTYSDNFIIGIDNKIPWDIEEKITYYEDLVYFNSITLQSDENYQDTGVIKKNIVIMGYNTYECIGKQKLFDRINIIITTKKLKSSKRNGIYFVNSLDLCMELCNKLYSRKNFINKIFIIGGEKIYNYFFRSNYYNLLDKVYITRIYRKYNGNKKFCELEENFYYTSVRKSDNYNEIEYRVLQYDPIFFHPEVIYLCKLFDMMKENKVEKIENIKNLKNVEIYQSFNFNLKIDLTKYFPLFSICKKNKEILIKNIMTLFTKDVFFSKINDIIIKIKNNNKFGLYINLLDLYPYNSIYYFNYKYDSVKEKNILSCNVNHSRGNMLSEVINNILFSSLLVHFICKLTESVPFSVNYQCMENYYFKDNKYKVEKLIWTVPTILPLLKIKDREQKVISDFEYNDLEFLGLEI